MPIFKNINDQFSIKVNGEYLKYWKSKLVGLEPLKLPKDPFGTIDKNGGFHKVFFPKDSILIENVKNSVEGSSILYTIIGSLQVLLYRYCNQNDFCMGLSLDGAFLNEFAKYNGFNIDLNPLPIRTQIDSGLAFESIIQSTKEAVFEALENSNVTIEELINDLRNDPIRDFFFNVLCIIKKEHVGNDQKNKPNEIDLKDFNANLVFEFEESDQYLNGSISFRTDVFGDDFINRMIDHFLQLLDSIRLFPQSKISELNILSPNEKSFLLNTLNNTGISLDENNTILDLFENQVKNKPDAIALEFEGNQLTYRQLDSKSNQLAHYLKKIGVNSEDPTPICLDRSLEMVIAIFGIIKAGGAYVPIDPFFPADRIDYMIEDTGANIVICSSETSKNFGDKINRLVMDKDLEVINQMPSSKVSPSPSPGNLVYIIYTSGSTGKPKGAMVEHRNLLNFVNSLSKIVEIDSSSIQLSVTTYIFDAFCLELFVPLTVGAKVILVSKEVSTDGFKLAKALAIHKTTHMKATPSGWQLLLNAGWNNPEGIMMTTGGEALGEETKNMLARTGKLWNLYGPTETTIDSTFKKMDVHERVTIGKPIDNVKIYILGPGGSMNPLGIPGELCIGGKGVGRGYLNRPELTAQKFVTDPFSDEKDAVMYHTGDLARWLSDGNIEYLGRLDDQVKIRGYRIELGEIESILQLHPSIKQAVVLAKEGPTGDKSLLSFVVCNGLFDSEAVISFLRTKLPDYMIPSLWKELENLPLSFSGKVDRKALREIEIEHIQNENYEAPESGLQKQLAAIWQKTLGLEKVGIQDDFFALGGHSLLAMKVMATIRSEMEIELSIREIFNFPTILQLAEILASKSSEESALIVPSITERPKTIPLSYYQQILWFIHQLSGSIQYHIPLIFRIEGELNKHALKNALVEIVNRHEILRTVISEKDGIGSQKILEKNQFKLDEKEINNKDIDKEISELIRAPFDLNNDHMLRACLITLGNEKFNLIITMHHIASDGWSVSILKKELRELYSTFCKGEPAHLPGHPYQYADYALWQRNLIAQESFQTKIDYWKNKLQNTPPLQLPTDYTRPSVFSTNGDIHRFTIDSNLVSQLNEIGKTQSVTLFMTLLAAYKILLYRYSGQEDICVGTPIAGRERNETEDLIGFFVNTLPQRTQIKASMRFDELLKEVKTSTLEVFDHQQVPFEVIVETMGPERDLSRNPVFQVLFVLQNFPDSKFQIEGAEVTEEDFMHFSSQFDMTLELIVRNEGIEGVLEYCTDLFKKGTITNFVSHYLELLQSICIHPTEKIGMLKIIPIDEEKKLLESFNPIQKTFPENITILDLFESQVGKNPEATAAVFDCKKLSYADLDKKSDQLANYLIDKGIQNEALIPICLDRSFEMVIGILGILKAGAAYIPIDPTYPEDRINFILTDTGAKLLLSTSDLKEKFPDSIEILCLETAMVDIEEISSDFKKKEISQNNLAYVIYTSGSTGTPKGVLIEHKGLVASTMARNSYYDYTGSVLLIPSFAFDSSVAVIFGALTTGGQLILCKSESIKSPHHIKELLKETETILCVPSYYRFLQEEKLLSDTRLMNVILAGENLDLSIVKLHFDKTKNVKLFNEYGPTEGTVWASVARINSPDEKVTIGRPIDYTKVYILNKDNQLNPINVPGELCIAGKGVARGYLNNPELNLEKFVQNPFGIMGDEKMYRTGDLARWLPDGNIEYLGRIDDQVKLRGYRIELGEVESVINQLKEVKESAVILREDIPGQKRLVGYVVLDDSITSIIHSQKSSSLKKELHSILPEYMVPSSIMVLESLPLTSNLKIDKKRLPKPEEQAISHREPDTEIEKMISRIWCESLKKEKIDINSDFFEIGGHSLLAVKVLSQIEKELDKKLPLNVIFKYPRIVDLAEYLEENTIHESSSHSLVRIKPNGSKPPFFIIHGVGSTASIYFQLAKYIEDEQPIYGFEPKGLNGVDSPNNTLEEMAAYYISLMIKQYPSGPYCIAGYSFGGYVAYEMARQLKGMGREVSKLILFDTSAYEDPEKLTLLKKIKLQLGKRLVNLGFAFKEPHGFYEQKSRSFKRKRDLVLIKLKLQAKPETQKDHESIIKVVAKNNVKILKKYKLNRYEGDLHLFKVKNRSDYIEDTKYYGWSPLVNKVHVVNVSGHHDNIFKKSEILKEMAEKIQIVLDEKTVHRYK